MTKAHLRQLLCKVHEDYDAGTLNSERCLQASLYHHLRNIFSGSIYEVYIEPLFRCAAKTGLDKIRPDVVVCKNGKIILVLELKFNPKQYVNWEDDFVKFSKIQRLKAPIQLCIKLDPVTGKFSDPYTLPSGVKLAFLSVANVNADGVDKKRLENHNSMKKISVDLNKITMLSIRVSDEGSVSKIQ